jgi:hypothetical protein
MGDEILEIRDERQLVKLVHACVNAIGTPEPGPIRNPLIAWSSYGISVTILGHEGVDAFDKLIHHLENRDVEGKPAKQIYGEKTLKTKTQDLMSDIVNQYRRYSTKDQIRTTINDWILHFHTDFPCTPYYIPITNLKLADPLTIGRVTFHPASHKFVEQLIKSSYYATDHTGVLPEPMESLRKHSEDLFQAERCSAVAKVSLDIDETLGYELCITYTEQALNVLRYYGYFLYSRPHQAYIGIEGRLSRGNLGILHHIPEGRPGLYYKRNGPLASYNLSEKNLALLRRWRLQFLSKLLVNDGKNELESSLLGAIEWLGRASQSVEPEARYLCLWIAVEMLVTCRADQNNEEKQGKLIAKRASMILPFVDDEERDKVQNYWNDKLYKVRCDLVHRGHSEDLADHLPKLEFYAPKVIMSYIEHLVDGSAASTKAELLSWLESGTSEETS